MHPKTTIEGCCCVKVPRNVIAIARVVVNEPYQVYMYVPRVWWNSYPNQGTG